MTRGAAVPMAVCVPAPGRLRRRTLLQLWAACFLAFLCTAHARIENLDATMTMHAARALWQRGDSGLRGSAQQPEWAGEALIADWIGGRAAAGVHEYGKRGTNGLTYVWFPIGHVGLLVPAVALGGWLERQLPALDERFAQAMARGPVTPAMQAAAQFGWSHAAVAMLTPPAAGATLAVLLVLLAQALGCAPRASVRCGLAIAFATQCFPLGNETLSDGPALCCLLVALLAVVRHAGAPVGRGVLVAGGAAAGAAVLVRYQHALMVPVLAVVLVATAWRRRRLGDVVAFAAGGLPFLLALLLVDRARFGNALDTGYPSAASWFNYPVWLGATKILIAAGKGILWFSPLLWLALPALRRRVAVPRHRALAAVLFGVPLLLFGSTNGWQSGQCWGVRYVTPGVVALLALVLPQARPWATHPRAWRWLVGAGLLVSLTSVVAPTRGHNQLAGQAVRAFYHAQLERGAIGEVDWQNLDEADHYFFEPRYSPLHAHWTYAWRAWRGAFEDERGGPRDGAAHTIEPLFGVTTDNPEWAKAPAHWEDRGGRHLWWRFFADLFGVSAWALLLPVVAAGAVLALGVHRQLSKN